MTNAEPMLFNFHEAVDDPVVPARMELILTPSDRSNPLLVLTDRDGCRGFAVGNSRHRLLLGILEHLVAPAVLGQDVRRIEQLVDEVYRHKRNYKYGGMPFFTCLGLVELAALDLLARRAGKPVHALCGPCLRKEIPVYVSRMNRDTTPEEECRIVAEQLAASGARAGKIKIGGRMSLDTDAAPGRTETLIALLRETVGPEITLYADANGSYGVEKAIEVGRLLEDHGYGWFEEPCPWQDFESTRAVADALDIPVAGGEQDSNPHLFAWMIRNHGVDVVQPDLQYCGGFIRASRVARVAEAAGMPVVPHSPGSGYRNAPLLHFAAITSNLGPFVEAVHSPEIQNGTLTVPMEPGWGTPPDATGDLWLCV